MTDKRSTQLQGITDLTVLADVKPGLVTDIFDSRSYVWRLERVLALLDTARREAREAALHPHPLTDSVARLRDIHFFRFALVPAPEGSRLLLNVTFDGGWEPYMRLIWGPLGTLLDLIFCHCDGYPLAAASSFQNYTDWVRRHEIPSQFFYADSGGTVADRAYLETLAAQQRHDGDRPGADLRAAATALRPVPAPQPTAAAVESAVRMLKGLYALAPYFGSASAAAGPVPQDDASVLLRFAQDLLPDLRDWIAQGLFDPGQRYDAMRPLFAAELAWLMTKRWTRAAITPWPAVRHDAVQAFIVKGPQPEAGRYVRGAMVLAQVEHAADARRWLSEAVRGTPAGAPRLVSDAEHVVLADGEVACSVALTYPGLAALGVHRGHLDRMPVDFAQGMADRAGTLGDLRSNHPSQWTPPKVRHRREPIEWSQVHVLIQLRTAERDDETQAARGTLLPRLRTWIDTHLPASSGLTELATEALWSRPPTGGAAAPRNHFGYVDGISQPVLREPQGSHYWDDGVKDGEVFLGWPNGRGDGPRPHETPDVPDWMLRSTFLVVRKIRTLVNRFDHVVEAGARAVQVADPSTGPDAARELVRAKLMGRRSDGTPLVTLPGSGGNDFDFRYDQDGRSCPFASHVRRANPRTTLAGGMPSPRILRRGMSYGVEASPDAPARDEDDCGVLFMAYNASIAEQFEVIQRWLSGANSGGVSSLQADPLLGVPQAGRPGVFTFLHGEHVIRVDLGDAPVCSLAWGLYAWVPSLGTLADLEALTKAPPAPAATRDPGSEPSPDEQLNQVVKAAFEDERTRAARWRDVVAGGGVVRIGRNAMVGGLQAVQEVLRDDGRRFSAAGYGGRMAKTLGRCPFGHDDAGDHAGHGRPVVRAVKDAITNFKTEAEAFDAAVAIVWPMLQRVTELARSRRQPATIDIVEIGTQLILGVLQRWFGVDLQAPGVVPGVRAISDEPVTCPGHFLTVARFVFSARPNETVSLRATGQPAYDPKDLTPGGQGLALRPVVANWVKSAQGTQSRDTLTARLLDTMKAYDTSEARLSMDEQQAIVANVMLGLPATLLGSWVKLVMRSARDGDLWRMQQRLPAAPPDAPTYHSVRLDLRPGLIDTLAGDPVADGIWRTVRGQVELGGVALTHEDVVWLGLGAALAEARSTLSDADWRALSEGLLFGGAGEPDRDPATPHQCPGRPMAIGLLMGMLACLLSAGALSTTPSPTVLALRPFPVD